MTFTTCGVIVESRHDTRSHATRATQLEVV